MNELSTIVKALSNRLTNDLSSACPLRPSDDFDKSTKATQAVAFSRYWLMDYNQLFEPARSDEKGFKNNITQKLISSLFSEEDKDIN
jgi:hypothetical protein